MPTTQAIPYPFLENSRQNIKHTKQNRPECVHPECTPSTQGKRKGMPRLAQNQKGKGQIQWRQYTVDGVTYGGLCDSCKKLDISEISPKIAKERIEKALRLGFVTADGKPDIRNFLEYEVHQQRVEEWKAHNKELGINIKFEDWFKYKGTGEKSVYLMYRKDYCENQDGMAKLTDGSYVGFTCRMTWPDPDFSAEELKQMRVLQVDHIDGNHLNNAIGPKCEKPNLQTLCVTCHNIKGALNGDFESPGRKTRNNEDYL